MIGLFGSRLQEAHKKIRADLADFNFKKNEPFIVGGDVVSFDKLLYKETLTPIASGDKKQGILMFIVPGQPKSALFRQGTTIELSCRDVAGNIVAAPIAVLSGRNDEHRHYIGLEGP